MILLFCILISTQFFGKSSQAWTEKCPSQCTCELDSSFKKAVICNETVLYKVPVQEMDPRVEVRELPSLKYHLN